MRGAGFYPIGFSRITFARNGQWYADGERITNRRIALLFARHLLRCDDGTYRIVIGDEQAPVEVEDTPWAVIQVDGDPKHGFVLTLNDHTREPLDPSTLAVGSDSSFSCGIKGGSARARFLRNAHYSLARHVEPAGQPGQFAIRIGGRLHLLAAPPGAE